MSEPTCPSCAGSPALAEIVDREVNFLGCTDCYGLFVTEENLGEYVAHATGQPGVRTSYLELLEEATAKLGGESKRTCPRCHEKMRRIGFGESPLVILERCALHGLWLDKKELTKVKRAARAHAAVRGLIDRTAADEEDDD
ncbi:MAG: zf-TFIIB domain-containing protein [Planctomycetota bacterium]